MSKGKLIAIEGLDGSGKATQAKLLAGYLAAQGLAVREVSFPDYGSDSSALVKMYLAGQFGQHPDDVNAYAASSFYAVDRYASYKKDWGSFYENGGIVIADRYTTSNAVHQCSKLPPEQWESFLGWLFDFEFHLLGLPAPDEVILHQRGQHAQHRRHSGRSAKNRSEKLKDEPVCRACVSAAFSPDTKYGLRHPAAASHPLASRWPRPQQQLPISATGGGHCCCKPFHRPPDCLRQRGPTPADGLRRNYRPTD